MPLRSIFALLTVALLTLIGNAIRLRRSRIPIPEGLSYLAETGVFYLIMGGILGSRFGGVLEPTVQDQLGPAIVLGLGWVGFLFGVQFGAKRLALFPASWWLVGQLHSILCIAAAFSLLNVVAPEIYRAYSAWLPYINLLDEGQTPCIVLAAACGGTSHSTVLLVQRLWTGERTRHVLQFMAEYDDLPGLFILAWVFADLNAREHPFQYLDSTVNWMCLTAILGLALGYLLKSSLHGIEEEHEIGIAMLSVLALAGGLAAYLHLPVVVVTTVAGAAYANRSRRSDEVHRRLALRVHLAYLLFLLLIGAKLELHALERIWPLALLVVIVRGVTKVFGFRLLARFLSNSGSLAEWSGLGLLGQGGMSLSMVVVYTRLNPSPASDEILALMSLSILMNGLIAFPLMSRLGKGGGS